MYACTCMCRMYMFVHKDNVCVCLVESVSKEGVTKCLVAPSSDLGYKVMEKEDRAGQCACVRVHK